MNNPPPHLYIFKRLGPEHKFLSSREVHVCIMFLLWFEPEVNLLISPVRMSWWGGVEGGGRNNNNFSSSIGFLSGSCNIIGVWLNRSVGHSDLTSQLLRQSLFVCVCSGRTRNATQHNAALIARVRNARLSTCAVVDQARSLESYRPPPPQTTPSIHA